MTMVRLRLEKISLIINCDCGGEFLAEDFKPICPYCNKEYCVSISLKRFKLAINPIVETAAENCT